MSPRPQYRHPKFDRLQSNRALGCLVLVLGTLLLWAVILLLLGALFGWWPL